MKKEKKTSEKPGPKPDTLKIDDDNWENAFKKAVHKDKPKEGWPKQDKKK